MRSLPYGSTVIQDNDEIGVADTGCTLGNNEHGHAPFEIMDCLPQPRVGRKIQRARAVIHNEDFRMPDNRARNRKPLLLTAGEVAAVLFDRRVQLALLALHNFFRLRGFQSLPDILIRSVRIAETHIVADSSFKQYSSLRNNADLTGQLTFTEGAYVFAVYKNSAFRNIVKPGDQVDERCFAAAGAADDTDGLSFAHGKCNACKRGRAASLIRKRNVPEFHCRRFLFASMRYFCRCRCDFLIRERDLGITLRIIHTGLYFQNVLNTVRTGKCLVNADNQ